MNYISAHFASADAVEQWTFNEHLVEVMCPEKNESIRKKDLQKKTDTQQEKFVYVSAGWGWICMH